jgi:hypothetical protein
MVISGTVFDNDPRTYLSSLWVEIDVRGSMRKSLDKLVWVSRISSIIK